MAGTLNGTVQTSGYAQPILFTDFNKLVCGKPVAADAGMWTLHVGQRVTLAEHGDTVHCDGIVVDPKGFRGTLSAARYVYVEAVPDTWGYYEEPCG